MKWEQLRPSRELLWQTAALGSRTYINAMQALERLVVRIEQVLDQLVLVGARYDDGVVVFRAKQTRDWSESEGKEIIQSLARKVAGADDETRVAMTDSLNAAIESGDVAADSDLSVAENREALWQWADQILSSLEWAFDPFPEQQIFRERSTPCQSAGQWRPQDDSDASDRAYVTGTRTATKREHEPSICAA